MFVFYRYLYNFCPKVKLFISRFYEQRIFFVKKFSQINYQFTKIVYI